jgi:hypothetical protein
MEYLISVKQLPGFLDISGQNVYNIVANCRKGIPMPFSAAVEYVGTRTFTRDYPISSSALAR